MRNIGLYTTASPVSYFVEASDLGDAEGHFWAAFCHNWGIGTGVDSAKAQAFCARGSNSETAVGLLMRALGLTADGIQQHWDGGDDVDEEEGGRENECGGGADREPHYAFSYANADARDIVAAKNPAPGDVTTKARRAFEKEPSCGKVRSERNRRPKTTSAKNQWQPRPASIDHTER
jgi:hypothetical protein